MPRSKDAWVSCKIAHRSFHKKKKPRAPRVERHTPKRCAAHASAWGDRSWWPAVLDRNTYWLGPWLGGQKGSNDTMAWPRREVKTASRVCVLLCVCVCVCVEACACVCLWRARAPQFKSWTRKIPLSTISSQAWPKPMTSKSIHAPPHKAKHRIQRMS